MIDRKHFDQLVAEFRGQQKAGSYEEQRAEWWGQFAFKISPEWIDGLDEDEALRLYTNTGWGVKLYNRTFLDNGIDKIKESLRYLLLSDEPIEQRFFNFVDADDL